MKMHLHRSYVSAQLPFDLDLVKLHLRVADDDDDSAISYIAKTAAREIEQFAQIALLTQTISVTLFDPTLDRILTLPIGPAADDAITTVTVEGEPFTAFTFFGGIRPCMWFRPEYRHTTPSQVTIEYQAGFGDDASSIPPDLAQALMDQAALHYDGRSPMDARSLTTSPHMARIGARYRGVQL
ncbi:phage head-tail connector protein [Sulfitobacter sp. EE-36]|uniref:head-tail connector protein n=1 Tax=Sulfitobacter TaxID=60136 RepID=UPI0000668D04|nr:phage head-tail connector protein [Sulfitobacter sp. EE-36]EAP84901.1 hypothetical protein EE36_03218 [Sulfitobacter sp. EE-36]